MAEVRIKSLQDRVFSKEEILQRSYDGLTEIFEFSSINLFLLDSNDMRVTDCYPEPPEWEIPESEKKWVIDRSKEKLLRGDHTDLEVIYIPDRSASMYTDKGQLKRDQQKYGYHCKDCIYGVLISEEEIVYGLLFIHNWDKKKAVCDPKDLGDLKRALRIYISDVVLALDNLFIHQKIESLMTDKRQLKQRIQKDQEDLKQRLLELTVLYDTSNALGYSLNSYQIAGLGMDSLNKVLKYDVCSVLLLDFVPGDQTIIRVNQPVNDAFIRSVRSNILSAITPFTSRPIDAAKMKWITEKCFDSTQAKETGDHMKSFANVPLIFKEEVIGMLNVCSLSENAFARNEMTFLHTIANQMASHLGRLKIVKKLEKSKMGSLVGSMREPVVMFDENHQLEIINPAAEAIFGAGIDGDVTDQLLFERFRQYGLMDLYHRGVSGETILNEEVTFEDRAFSINITGVQDAENNLVGTVLVFRDITEIQKSNRVKTQRLDVISKVSLIIKSITDLEYLLSLLMEFVLGVAHAEMGAIQLKKGRKYFTKVHSNFPDKIRRNYKFKTGETISEYVASSGEPVFLTDYFQNDRVVDETKILLDSYVCIPIVVKDDIIGIMNIARKFGSPHQKLTPDDMETLVTVASLSGTAIYNALLYQETLRRQKLDQELKVANEIQNRLLPERLPNLKTVEFGSISIPAREIGGDYYDFFELENGHIGIVIADIVGKGIPAGLFMAMLKSILHTHITPMTSPKDALVKINSILCKDPVINKFIPLFYGILDPAGLTLKYCNGGHEPAIIFSRGSFEFLDTNGFPLGALEDSEFEEREIKLNDKDLVLMYTDGVVDARNESGERFGPDHLEDLIRATDKLPVTEIVETIYGQVRGEFQYKGQLDDLTLVGFRVDLDREKRMMHQEPIEVKEFRVSSSRKNISKIRSEVQRICERIGFVSDEIFNIKLAINEAQANVIEHAYFGSENGEIRFKFLTYTDRLEIQIKDFGPGVGQRTIRGDVEHLEELEGSGLGVYLIKTLMDKVEYKSSRVGTEMILTKFIAKES